MVELRDRLYRNWTLLVVAFVGYVPVIFSSPGVVGADTKTYLYLDPGRVIDGATTLWDSNVALGTVTHQNIGYLWPLGPFYWIFETIGSPDWFAQRLWLGTLLFTAAAGVRFLLRTLDWKGGGLLVAMLAYELTPYLLDYSARISVVLLPWAGLPWMIALTIRAARTGGWRHPALFALLTVTVGSVNATSLLFVGLAPVLWLAHAVIVERSLAVAQAVRTALRIAVLTVGASLWWIAGLALQSGYSLPVTRYTETYQTVASASTAPEALRGLGYWFFYGNDKFGPWIEPSIEYTQGVWLLFLSYGLVVLALLGAAAVGWRHRSYFVLLIVVGGLIAVGAHPFDGPSPLGSVFKELTRSDVGLALRSTPRALPLLVLSTAILLGTVVNALEGRWGRWARPFTALVLAAVVLNNPAIWRIRMIEPHLQRDEEIPDYWIEAIDALDSSGRDGRVMEVPGSDFASYRWGNTVDPITPGLLDRGYVARELVPFGSAESAALLTAFDRRFQEDTLDPDSIVPIASLMSVDDVVHRADLTFERFRTPRPVPTADLLDHRAGLGPGTGFGPAVPNRAGPEQTLLDEAFLATDPALPDPAPVTAYPVPDALPVVRLRRTTGATVIVGDAEGLVDAAGAGLLDLDRPIWFGADLAFDEDLRSRTLTEPASIIITDTNKKRAKRWGTLRENVGYVERVGEEPLEDDPTDNRLVLFAQLDDLAGVDPDDTRTVSRQPGPFTVQASNYGNPVTYTNDDRPAHAVDGNVDTAWVVAAFAEARGERLVFSFAAPTELDEITFVQPQVPANRYITEVVIRGDGRTLVRASLDETSRRSEGQRIRLGAHDPVVLYEVELTDLDVPVLPTYPGISPVGFAEVRLGVDPAPVVESLRTPTAFIGATGDDLDRHDLSVILTRERSNPQEPVREDPEAEMRRDIVLPVAREFDVQGAVRLSAAVRESDIDALIGRSTAVDGTPMTAQSSGRLPGHLRSAASFAFDGDISTAWTGRFGPQVGQWVELSAESEISFTGLRLDVVVDDAHSVPTRARVTVDGAIIGDYPTGLVTDDASRGTTIAVDVPATGTGRRVRIEMLEVEERFTRDWYSNTFVAMPVSIAEVGVSPGRVFGPATEVDTGCLALLQIDGEPVAARVTGSADAALDRFELTLTGCSSIATDAGEFTVQTQSRLHGLDIDQLVLRSARTLAARPVDGAVTVVDNDDTSYRLSVSGSASDRWLVLGQSHNTGWEATVDGRSLGDPVLIDGFANGWLLPAAGDTTVELNWRPQDLVTRSIWISAATVLLALLLAWFGRRDRGAVAAIRGDGPDTPILGPFQRFGLSTSTGKVSPLSTLLVGAGLAGFAFVNLPRWPAMAIVVGLVAAVTHGRRSSWISPALLGAGSLGVAALAIMIAQRRFRYPADFGWPQQFESVHVWGVLCLLFLFVDYVTSALTPDVEP